MPSSTPKQARFMRAVEHNPQFAAKVGVPQKVGSDFAKADASKLAAQLRSDAATAQPTGPMAQEPPLTPKPPQLMFQRRRP